MADATLRATAVGVTSAVLSPSSSASTPGQVGGSLDAKLDLSSSTLNLDDVEGEVVLERLNLTVADLPVTQHTPTRVVARGGVARIESWAWESEGTSIEVTGKSTSVISRRRFWRTGNSMLVCSRHSSAARASAQQGKSIRACRSPAH